MLEETQAYIPKRKVKKDHYLELKEINEEYNRTLDFLGTICKEGLNQTQRESKARQVLKDNPDLILFHAALKTDPTPGESRVCEGFRYWIMKENGTLPPRKKSPPLRVLGSRTGGGTLSMDSSQSKVEVQKPSFRQKLASFFGF